MEGLELRCILYGLILEGSLRTWANARSGKRLIGFQIRSEITNPGIVVGLLLASSNTIAAIRCVDEGAVSHQSAALEALRQTVAQGVRRIVLQAPTGSGKTLLSAAIIESALAKGKRVTFVVSSLALIDQTVEALYHEDIRDVGVIQANHVATNWGKPVQVASVQTLLRRGSYPQSDVVIIDECHALHECHKTWLTHEGWRSVPFIGLSATPYTKGLGKYFQTMITVATTQEMIDKGILSPFRVFATGHPDLKDVKTVAGDYHEGQLSNAMQAGSLSADIVRTWEKHWNKDKTLCFGVDCAHAQALQARFEEAGISCGYQDARTPADERAEIKRKFHNGTYQVVTNVGTLTTGVDWDVRCLILARPTKSEMLYQQIVGRALRTAPGKEHALILDHSDTTERLGFVTDIFHDHLHDGKENTKAAPRKPMPKECTSCTAMKPAGMRKCPNCGFEPVAVSNFRERDDVELHEVDKNAVSRRASARTFTQQEKAIVFAELKGYALKHNYKSGWADNKYRDKFKCWPERDIKHVAPIVDTISLGTLNWIRHTQIAWRNSQRRRANV